MKIPRDDNRLASASGDDYEGLINEDRSQVKTRSYNPIINCFVTMLAFVQFSWIHHRTEFILALVLAGSVSLAVTGAIEAYENGQNVNVRKHSFSRDYTDLKSALELKLGQVDHWCLDGSDSRCPQCEDPTHPSSRSHSQHWGDTYVRNVKLAKDYLTENPEGVDVIFLGDSNTEARVGTFKGLEGEGNLAEVLTKSKRKFDKLFQKKSGGEFNGLALGIAGDSSPNLLWRIQQNEFRDLEPKVWWINIGSNDLLSTRCSEEITIMGILRVVEELMARNDGASIVINSILPVAVKASMSLEGKYIHNKYWYSINQVNQNLQKFAKKHPGVKFFDAKDILTEFKGHNLYMKKEMFVDKVHLSVDGQAALAEAQANTVKNILQKKAENDVKVDGNPSKSGDYRNSDSDGSETSSPDWWTEQDYDDFLNFDIDLDGSDDWL
jgi:lysophospholipase L1-like esterase